MKKLLNVKDEKQLATTKDKTEDSLSLRPLLIMNRYSQLEQKRKQQLKVYIQKNESNDCANINFAIALDGFDKMGKEMVSFTNLDEITQFTKEDIFVGFVDETKQTLANLKISYEDLNCYPPEIESYLGRKVWKDTFLNFVKKNKFGCFIKPMNQNKLFTGKVIN